MLLSSIALKVIKDYERQRRMGKTPVFNPDHFPEFREQLTPDVWQKTPSQAKH
jgi:AGCS family alanine or glycine:cation symporter